MLFIKRILTTAVLFVVLFIVLYLLTSGILGAVAGMRAGSNANVHDFNSGYDVGREAGMEIGRKYGAIIIFGASGIAGVAAGALSFSSAIPWCRRKYDRQERLPDPPHGVSMG